MNTTADSIPPMTNGDPVNFPKAAAMRADRIVDDARDAAHRAVDSTADRVKPGVEQAAEKVESLQQMPADLLADARAMVRERPILFVGIAFAAGMLTAMMRR